MAVSQSRPSSLIFEGYAGAYTYTPDPWSRLDRQTNTRAYYQTELVTAEKSFIVQAFQRKGKNFT